VRAALAKEQGILLLFGADEDERGNLRGRFFQESNFYYLSGWTEPGAALLLTANDEILLLPPRNEIKDRYTGKKLTPDDEGAAASTGFAKVIATTRLELTFFQYLENAKKIYGFLDLDQTSPIRRLAGSRPIENAASLIYPSRQIKSPGEISLIQRAIDVSAEAHRTAWRRVTAGLAEHQISATMVNVYFEAGCERSAYPPIVASGKNATVLHYNRNDRRMDNGEMLLMDVGGECSMYAADLTRTVPVNGRFTDRQKELYRAVLGAQRAAIAAIKPGMRLAKDGENSLYQIAVDYLNKNGKAANGDPLGKYMTHGLGHHVGLDVHDPGPPQLPLEAGNVITIEPGVYLPDEGIGIRIEDMVLVTADGHKVLSSGLPSEPEEIEKIQNARRR
jgi:Xaa-Pro aminopeptidase